MKINVSVIYFMPGKVDRMSSIINSMNTLLGDPMTLFALAGLLILILAGIYVTKLKFSTKMILHIGLTLALTVVLHAIRLYHMPQGGSVTLGAMVPLMIISLAYGSGVGMLTGFLYGMLNLFQDPFILNPIQVLFDYPLPFMAFGIMAYFRKHILLGATVAMGLRLLCHFISGVAFFAEYAPPGMNPYWYSLTFNMTYLLPELIITLVLLKVLPVKRILNQIK